MRSACANDPLGRRPRRGVALLVLATLAHLLRERTDRTLNVGALHRELGLVRPIQQRRTFLHHGLFFRVGTLAPLSSIPEVLQLRHVTLGKRFGQLGLFTRRRVVITSEMTLAFAARLPFLDYHRMILIRHALHVALERLAVFQRHRDKRITPRLELEALFQRHLAYLGQPTLDVSRRLFRETLGRHVEGPYVAAHGGSAGLRGERVRGSRGGILWLCR
mmetsp:Transcript_19707/g.54134  ORF Transcript_19707/g.54134 Transcript_19707/m.54134 type:complete len:219 (-) Transcript_19707:218-874(-)